MLATLAALKAFLGVSTVASDDARLAAILAGADAQVKSFLQRGHGRTSFANWPESGSGTEFYDGPGTLDLLLRYTPVSAVASVYLDSGGYYGDGASAFAATTLLTVGTDYVLVRDDGSQSASGRLRRLGVLGSSAWMHSASVTQGSLAGRTGPSWPRGQGNIKVTYTAGFTEIPRDLTLATLQVAAYVQALASTGGMLIGSESLGEYSNSQSAVAIQSGVPQLGSALQTLKRYRGIAV